ncbi:hypothetical protein V8E52_010952 [Russula decolorans]
MQCSASGPVSRHPILGAGCTLAVMILMKPPTFLFRDAMIQPSCGYNELFSVALASVPSGVAILFKLSACQAQNTVVKTQFFACNESNPETIENCSG